MQHEVIIGGGGMVGLATALACARQGIRSLVLERGQYEDQLQPNFDGRTSAIALGSARFLDGIGAWQGVVAQAQPIADIRITDDDSRMHLHYDHREVGEDPMGYIVENRHLRFALLEAVRQEPCITLMEGARIADIKADATSTTVTLHEGDMHSARLLIAADGKFSSLRQMAGIEVYDKRYPQTAIVCTVVHEKPHQAYAQERFLPAGPFAILPMTDDQNGRHRSSIVWTEKAEFVPELLALPRDELNDELRQRFGDYLGHVAIEGEVFSYPLVLRYAKRLIGERFALVGDAGHAIHPIAGQGVNVGFRDIEALAPMLGKHARLGLDIGTPMVLEPYEKARQFDMHSMIAATDSINALFSNRNPLLQMSRRLGLASVQKLPPLRRTFMKHAMGV
jgi:2-octaprenyl-6-methoxyphenol hydroxylase